VPSGSANSALNTAGNRSAANNRFFALSSAEARYFNVLSRTPADSIKAWTGVGGMALDISSGRSWWGRNMMYNQKGFNNNKKE
jgi:hypothetical protein